MSNFQFQIKPLQNAEENFKQVKLDPQKRQIIGGVAKIISKYININELALRGFVLLSVKDTQQELKLELKNLDLMAPMEKKQFIGTVFRIIGQKLASILRNPTQEDLDRLTKALAEALEFRMSQNI